MNQVFLQFLAQDPSKAPGVVLSFRWLLSGVHHLEKIFIFILLPLLNTGLGCVFTDMDDMWDQLFSPSGILYISLFMGLVPKPQTSSKLWFDANLFTVVVYVFYFAELAVFASLNLDINYEMSWILSLAFSTTSTVLFYGILLALGLSTPAYFQRVLNLYLFADMGSLLALGTITPFYSDKIFIALSILILVCLLPPASRPFAFWNRQMSPLQFDRSIPLMRCLFWGALTVWTDYIALTPFYVLEMILASECPRKRD
jgi:Kef-type K+ transport system membrane component KefB